MDIKAEALKIKLRAKLYKICDNFTEIVLLQTYITSRDHPFAVCLENERKSGKVESVEKFLRFRRIGLHYPVHIDHQHAIRRILGNKLPSRRLFRVAYVTSLGIEDNDVALSFDLAEVESS